MSRPQAKTVYGWDADAPKWGSEVAPDGRVIWPAGEEILVIRRRDWDALVARIEALEGRASDA